MEDHQGFGPLRSVYVRTEERGTRTMRFLRFVFFLALLGTVAACSNPAGPRYPQEDDDQQEPGQGDNQGFVLTGQDTFWV